MDTDLSDELRRLRARAFGPAADIEQDPAALQRLRELEALSSATWEPPPVPVEEATASEGREVGARDVEVREVEVREVGARAAVLETPPSQEVLPATETPRAAGPVARRTMVPRPLSRRLRVVWAATIIAAAVVAGGVGYGLARISPVAVSNGAPQIATLSPSASIDIPPGWLGTGPSSAVYEFHGLVLFETTGGFSAAAGTDCFTAIASEYLPDPDANTDSYSINGPIYSGCRVGAFPATLSIIVDSSAPAELRARYPGDALQFVRDGDRIGVFLDAD